MATIALSGRRRAGLAFDFAAPALVISVAYIDPGNFAANVAAGSRYGYRLLWVVLVASAIAMLFQALSSKLGLVTGKSLAGHMRDAFPTPLRNAAWIASEAGAMATDVAEVLGAALAFHLLLGVSLSAGVAATFVLVGAILALERLRFRPHEAIVIALVGVVSIAYLIESAIARPVLAEVVRGATVPWIGGKGALATSVAIVGATVMPHALYYHSSLARDRMASGAWYDVAPALRRSTAGIVVALSIAAAINLAMTYVSAATFGSHGFYVGGVGEAYRSLTPLLGRNAALIFGIALLASGISSSIVGTSAGQTIMQDFVSWAIPAWARRTATMLPAMAVAIAGVDVTHALIGTQIVLSFLLPLPVAALVYFTSSRSTMGRFANRSMTVAAALLATVLIVAMNGLLLSSLY